MRRKRHTLAVAISDRLGAAVVKRRSRLLDDARDMASLYALPRRITTAVYRTAEDGEPSFVAENVAQGDRGLAVVCKLGPVLKSGERMREREHGPTSVDNKQPSSIDILPRQLFTTYTAQREPRTRQGHGPEAWP